MSERTEWLEAVVRKASCLPLGMANRLHEVASEMDVPDDRARVEALKYLHGWYAEMSRFAFEAGDDARGRSFGEDANQAETALRKLAGLEGAG